MNQTIKPTAEQAILIMNQGYILRNGKGREYNCSGITIYQKSTTELNILGQINHWNILNIFNGQNEFTIQNFTLTPDKTVFFPCGVPLKVSKDKVSWVQKNIMAITSNPFYTNFYDTWGYAKLPEPEPQEEKQTKVIDWEPLTLNDVDRLARVKSYPIEVMYSMSKAITQIVNIINKEQAE